MLLSHSNGKGSHKEMTSFCARPAACSYFRSTSKPEPPIAESACPGPYPVSNPVAAVPVSDVTQGASNRLQGAQTSEQVEWMLSTQAPDTCFSRLGRFRCYKRQFTRQRMLFGAELDSRGAWAVPDTRYARESGVSATRGSSRTYSASRGTSRAAEYPLACHCLSRWRGAFAPAFLCSNNGGVNRPTSCFCVACEGSNGLFNQGDS